MPTEICIRLAQQDDAEELLGLIVAHACFEGSVATISLDEVRAILSNNSPPTLLFVAASGAQLLGYGAVTFDFSLWRACHWAHLDCLFVRENARCGGIGAKLLRFAKELSKRHEADRLEWQTPAWNKRAAQFYAREGAYEEAKRRFHLVL